MQIFNTLHILNYVFTDSKTRQIQDFTIFINHAISSSAGGDIFLDEGATLTIILRVFGAH